jgi:hypothetical protein
MDEATMTKLDDIPKASAECIEDDQDRASRKGILIARLEAEGLRPIAVGRAVLTIERTDSKDEVPAECMSPETLKLSVYSDPDVSGDEQPVCLYLEGGRYGLSAAHLQVIAGDGRQRIFKMEQRLVRDEF